MYYMNMGDKEKNTPGNFNEKDSKIIESSKQSQMAKQSVSQIKKAAGLGGVSVLQKPEEFFAKKKNKK